LFFEKVRLIDRLLWESVSSDEQIILNEVQQTTSFSLALFSLAHKSQHKTHLLPTPWPAISWCKVDLI
jgi:hypothetical protein